MRKLLPFPAEVVFTDASLDWNKIAAGDATERTKHIGKLAEVEITSVSLLVQTAFALRSNRVIRPVSRPLESAPRVGLSSSGASSCNSAWSKQLDQHSCLAVWSA